MSIDRLPYAASADAPPELLLAARALAAPLHERGIEAVELPEPWNRAGDAPRLVLGDRDEPGLIESPLQMILGRSGIDLLRDGERIGSFPFFGPPLPPPRDPRRVVVRGGASSRRTRMIDRTLAVLARTNIRSLCWGACADLERSRSVDEVHPDPGVDELTRLLASAGAALDPAESEDESTLLTPLAASCGIPVVSRAAAWSPESFAETVLAAVGRVRVEPERTAERAAVRILEALSS